jgi:hypothetical protein
LGAMVFVTYTITRSSMRFAQLQCAAYKLYCFSPAISILLDACSAVLLDSVSGLSWKVLAFPCSVIASRHKDHGNRHRNLRLQVMKDTFEN